MSNWVDKRGIANDIIHHTLSLIALAATEPHVCSEAIPRIKEIIGTEYYDGCGDRVLEQVVEFLEKQNMVGKG